MWEIPNVPKIEKQVISIPNFVTPVQSISNPSIKAVNRRMLQEISNNIPFYPDPKPVKIPMPEFPGNMDINPELNTDSEEDSPFQESVISEIYQRPNKSFFQEPQELESLVNTGR